MKCGVSVESQNVTLTRIQLGCREAAVSHRYKTRDLSFRLAQDVFLTKLIVPAGFFMIMILYNIFDVKI